MNKRLYSIAIDFLKKTYQGDYKSIGSTQWNTYITSYNKEKLQVLTIVGTNGITDWFWNFLPFYKDGVKYGAYISVSRILRTFIRKPNMPLLISCHSKSGPTGIYLQELLNAEYCVAFCPARGFKEDIMNKATTMFIDLDDVVPKVGFIIFKHRKCNTIFLPKDKKWYNIKGRVQDHLLTHIKEYIDKMEE